MKVLILGATGATGQLIVRDATASGHYVVALVRAKASSNLPGVEVIEGDVRDEGTLARALNGCDAVVGALGTGMGFREVDLLTVATRALVAAMTRAGVRRLISISALGVGDSRNHGGFVFDRLYVLRNQLVHGGSTWNSGINRTQVRDGAAIHVPVRTVRDRDSTAG